MDSVLRKKLDRVGAEESDTIQNMLKVVRSQFIATFLQSFGHQTPISDLHRMFWMLMELYEEYEQRDECEQRDDITPLFSEMLGILKERLGLAGTDEEERLEEYNIIQPMIDKIESMIPKTHAHPFFKFL